MHENDDVEVFSDPNKDVLYYLLLLMVAFHWIFGTGLRK